MAEWNALVVLQIVLVVALIGGVWLFIRSRRNRGQASGQSKVH
ncbi:putative membrane protein YqjE [Yonghaparkia alkaliphila]|uniref:Putative membrane protein YqjE n=1 Tax=Microcella alkalica TaxID=355930 RepID=A0A839ECJ9_9MICO|nr:putative membrane protein YqjE [Microcella alkalica]MBA8849058.1 putative membrane protein YqjE [Microcella alkalica]